ncbi:YdeI/OmpD-associated family protein [Brevibacillus brevis]|nr:YdeI/OmpD-associated family protein [Brevibacillus brevis]
MPKIEDDLRHVPKELAFYQSLTPGYQKDWARYVYSAGQEGKRANRRAEMIAVLAEGHLYRRGK